MGKTLESRVEELEKIVSILKGKSALRIRKKMEVGDTFEICGSKWKILDITEAGYLCLSEKLKDEKKFDASCNDWKSSSLRKYLNGEFLEALQREVGAENIIPFKRDLLSMDGQTEYGCCEDKVSLLNVDEYRRYRKHIPNTDSWWWLITPDSTPCNNDSKWVAVVSPSGNFYNYYCSSSRGVRPFCIFSSLIFESGEV